MRIPILIVSLLIGTAANSSNLLLSGFDENPGVILFNFARYQEAEEYFQSHLDKSEDLKHLSLLYLAKHSVLKNEGERAVEYIEKSLAIRPNSTEELMLAAESYCTQAMQVSIFSALSLGKKCGHYYNQAANQAPNHIKALRTAIFFHLDAPSIAGGSEEQANNFLRQLEKISDEAARTPRLLMVESAEGEETALELAIRYSNLDYSEPEFLYELAAFLEKREHTQTAEALFRKVMGMSKPGDNDRHVRDAMYRLGILLIQRDSIQAGVTMLERYVATGQDTLDPNYFWSRWRLALAHKKLGNRVKYQEGVHAIKRQDYSHLSDFAEEFEDTAE